MLGSEVVMTTNKITMTVPKGTGVLDIEEQIAQAIEQAKKQAMAKVNSDGAFVGADGKKGDKGNSV
jgi:transcriptional/translational regulatory protein YebC/TACO1